MTDDTGRVASPQSPDCGNSAQPHQPWRAAALSLAWPGSALVVAGRRRAGFTLAAVAAGALVTTLAAMLIPSVPAQALYFGLPAFVAIIVVSGILAIQHERRHAEPGDPAVACAWRCATLSLLIPGLGHLVEGSWRWVPLLAAVLLPQWLRTLATLIAVWASLYRRPIRVRARGVAVALAALTAVSAGVTALMRDVLPHPAIRSWRIPSAAMQPTLEIGDFCFSSGLSAGHRTGDVIVFRYPLDRTVSFVKRVIATPGQSVEIRDKVVFVDGARLDEPYVQHIDRQILPDSDASPMKTRDTLPPFRVPPGMLFVLGDNRDNSSDSRFWGFVPVDDVYGRVTKIYFPPSHARCLPRLAPRHAAR